jgi:glycosyltransferase involved in cell wall biosynthesis
VSSDLKRKLISLSPQAALSIDVISMGIDANSFPEGGETRLLSACTTRGSQRMGRTVLFIGRLTEIKALDVLLKAMSELSDVQLIVAGDGPLRAAYESQAGELSVRAVFLGKVSAAQRTCLLRDCDAVVIPSRALPDGRTEGTPVVCLEAMAAGRLVIASRSGGLAELIKDGQNGLLFDASDHLMLAKTLVRALGDDYLRETISANARQFAQRYDWREVAPQFIRIINDSLDDDSITIRQGNAVSSAE